MRLEIKSFKIAFRRQAQLDGKWPCTFLKQDDQPHWGKCQEGDHAHLQCFVLGLGPLFLIHRRCQLLSLERIQKPPVFKKEEFLWWRLSIFPKILGKEFSEEMNSLFSIFGQIYTICMTCSIAPGVSSLWAVLSCDQGEL